MAEGANPYAMMAKAGLGLAGGFFGSKRAGNAIKRAGTTLNEGYRQAAEDVWKLPGYVNPAIAEAYGTAGEDVYSDAWQSAANIEDRAARAQAGMDTAVTGANQYLDPYITGGQQAYASLFDMVQNPKQFTAADLEFDPGYQFRLSEGQKALERSAAARGTLRTGGTLKALERYAQDAASQEYAAAFERASRDRQQRQQSLASLAGMGYNAGSAAGQNLIGGAQYGGNVGMAGTTQAGNWLNPAAQYKGNARINSALTQGQNIWNAGQKAIDYGLRANEATAMSQYGLGNVWGNFYSQAGNTLGDLFGGFLQRRGQGAGMGNT